MKRKVIMCLFLLSFFNLFAQDKDIELEELQNMRAQGIISEEDYEILKEELNKEKGIQEGIYDLSINSKLVTKTYEVKSREGKLYFPLKKFFEFIGFGNYQVNKNKVIVKLGTALREEKIDLTKDGFVENDEIYVESNRFKEVFLSGYEIDENNLKIRTYLSFDTPKEIIQLVDINKEKLLRKENENELVFTSERKLFDLGYTRVQLGKTYDKVAGEKSYTDEWDGMLSYQGGLLYGEITADYNLKEHQLDTVRLEYDDLWKGHKLDIESRRVEKSREWGLQFYKDRSFYEDAGGEVVISERVPIGSRAELIYMGTPIEIKDDDNGVVEFSNPLIRTDRTYTLRVYEPDGKITEREIKTVKDYFLQKKGEIEYRIGINERKTYDRYEADAKFYYGISDKLTLGFGYGRKIEEISPVLGENSIEYINDITADVVYGGTFNGLSYTFNLSGEKTIDNLDTIKYIDGNEERISLSERYRYLYLNQFNYGKWKLIYEHEEFGKFYDENRRDKFDVEYDIFDHLNLGYEWEKTRYRINQDSELKRVFTADFDYSWNRFLFSLGTSQDIEERENNEYRASIYYSGWQNLTGRLENTWTNDGKDYETKLTIYNNNYKGYIDFSTELAYSNKDKERVTFSLSIKLDDWLTLDNEFSDDGARNHRIGIDKVIDMRNPTKKLDSLDSSRVKVITFIDTNNNNICDIGEERVGGVEVRMGGETITTDKNGEGLFYGISNGNIYDMKATIKKPSFTLGDNILKVKSNFSSTIDAYIPIKPMLTLNGRVELDEILKLKESEKEAFYNDLIIELKGLDGKVIETTMPDNEGIFSISGLFPKDYYIEVTYLGTKYDLKAKKEEIELLYSRESSINNVILKVDEKNIDVNMQRENLN